jgi:phosphohistidine phosphatase
VELILWRHCDAESGIPDELRPLTPRGWCEAQRVARWLAPRLPAKCRVYVSPAVRAQQTAEALQRPFATRPLLASGASVADVLEVAQWPDADTAALIVGHEPTLGRVVAALLAPSETERPVAKGGVVWLVSGVPADPAALLKAAVDPSTVAC